jgi:hypothetical protein
LILPPRNPTIRYLKKFDHPLFNIERGREFTTIDYNTGWIEHMSTYCDVYYTAGIPEKLIEIFKEKISFHRMMTYNWNQELTELGFIKHLTELRKETAFSLPLFGSALSADSDIPLLTCGGSRFTATFLSGQPLDTIPCLWQMPKGTLNQIIGPATLVTNTLQAEELCNLEMIEYHLEFDYNDGKPVVISSILRGTEYSLSLKDAQRNNLFTATGKGTMSFWDSHKEKNSKQIKITVACNSESQDLVKYDASNWEVTFVDLATPDFSFSNILSQFGNPQNPQLLLELRGITESLRLEYFLPLVDKNKVWFYTNDKKVNLIDTTKGPASATWPIIEWGNFVK